MVANQAQQRPTCRPPSRRLGAGGWRVKQVFYAEAIGLTPEEERRHRRSDTLRQARREALPRVVELTGVMLSGALLYRPVKPKADYKHANAKGTRGVWLYWTLECGPIYRAHYRTSWTDWHQRIITVTPVGRILYVTEEEARACLANATSA